MAATTKLNAADVDALVNARHPEPRSLLGYHEYARAGDTPVCIVRVLEPDAAASARALGRRYRRRCGARAAARGRPVRRPRGVSPAAAAVHAAGFVIATAPRPSSTTRITSRRNSPTTISICSAKATTTRCITSSARTRYVVDGLAGTRFAVWAPNAERVSVVGNFNFWDGRKHAMQARGGSGIWEIFVPGCRPGRCL